MIVSILLLVIGIPIIVALVLRASARVRAISRLADKVREDMERNPSSPYAALSDLLQDRQSGKGKNG